MSEFFVRKETQDEQFALGATHLDDVDLIYSKHIIGPWGPALVAVAVKGGQHVCWQCGSGFIDEARHRHRPEEVQFGYSRILLHACCVNPTAPRKLFTNVVRGLQHRRELAKAAKRSESVAEAASSEKKSGIIV